MSRRLSHTLSVLLFIHPNSRAVSDALSLRCQARKQPASHAELVEYFLDTEGEEMNFEVARCRPMITEDFMTHLSTAISERSAAAICVRAACVCAGVEHAKPLFVPPAVHALHAETLQRWCGEYNGDR